MSVTYISEGDAATPDFMNEVLNRAAGETFNVKSFGAQGDGVTDDTAAIQAAIDAAEAAGGGTVFLPPGRYLVSVSASGEDALTISSSNVALVGVAATIVCPDPSENMLLFEDVLAAVGGGRSESAAATLTADVPLRGNTLALSTSDHGLAPGDVIQLVSDGEVFSGVPGASGFEQVMKGELCEVRSVDGATVLIRGRTADSYDATSHTVSVYTWDMLENIHVRGIRFEGAGRRAVLGNSQGQTGVRLTSVRNASVTDCRFEGLQAHAVSLQFGMYFIARGLEMIGDPDIGFGDDHDNTSPFLGFYGVHGIGWQGATVTDCTGRYLRRLADMGSSSTLNLPGRYWIMSDNLAEHCHQQGLGAHTGSDIVIANNIVRGCHNGIGSRAKRSVIVDNIVEGTYPQDDGGAGVSIGPAIAVTTEADWEGLDFGDCEMRGNTIRGFGRPIRWLNVGGRYVKIVGNTVEFAGTNTFNNGVEIRTHSIDVLEIRDNVLDCSSMEDSSARGYGIEIEQWGSDNGRLDELLVEGNTIISPARAGIILNGVQNGNAKPDMVWRVARNLIRFDTARSTPPLAHVVVQDGGHYGRLLIVENDFRGAMSASRPISIPNDRTQFWEAPVVHDNSQDLGIGTGSRRRLIVEENTESFTGTIQTGDRLSQSLAQGSPYERVVTAFGTIGTLSGVTGDMTSGSSTLVVSDASDIFVGAYLRIAGAGAGSTNLDARVLAIDGATLTMSESAGTTVDDASVAFKTPTIGPMGTVGARANGTATLVNGNTSIAVAHGLGITPAIQDISVTPIEAWGAMTQFWVSNVGGTQFTINADQDPGQDVGFAWSVSVQ